MKTLFLFILITIFLNVNVYSKEYNKFKLNDYNNLFVISSIKEWEKNKKLSKKYGYEYWERSDCLYFPKTNTTSCSYYGILNNRDKHLNKDNLVYVGKWHYVKKIDNYIRYIAYQTNRLHSYFEMKNKNNKNITYLPLNLKYKIKPFTKDYESVLLIQWFDKYGYNAYLDLKTGEIKEAKE